MHNQYTINIAFTAKLTEPKLIDTHLNIPGCFMNK